MCTKKKNHRMFLVGGKWYTLPDVARRMKIKPVTLRRRMYNGWDEEELFKPVREKRDLSKVLYDSNN